MLNLGDTIFVQGTVVGVEKNRDGNLLYTIEVPNQYCRVTDTERIRVLEDNTALVTQLFTTK